MPLESCMLILDNSEYMRNGDYPPTRFQAQAEAVQTVFTAKTDSNPESAVGLMSMAGNSPSLLVTPTNDLGKLLSSLSKVNISGISSLSTSISIAQLSLKHRENKNQRQRIVVFIGSPLTQEADSKDNFVKLGKKLRKNNVLIDVITFGDEGRENDEKLGALIEAVGGEESHLVSIPPGPRFLSDVILSSPILFDGEAGAAGGSGGAGGEGEFGGEDGIDPNMDPELAMAIRMSLQEAQEAAARANPPTSTETPASAGEAQASASGSATLLPSALTQPLSNANDQDIPMVSGDQSQPQTAGEEEDEDEELRRAMALSRGDDVDMAEGEGDEDEDDEAAIARAIAMSLEEAKEEDD
ncbi:hypothetical protein I302_103265 [Kwoniella bestiolae CBS 10118]|uniref:26S proteasome regulatory subunit N10 n=1 Tax=Kwoniella bestiolae CBS 10118 TaxID=1296100 RepID=A0A1B9G7X9_9TREE|nr:26S proteasome regulatory subunit N10 [Kwoniella bestiolae CBS 10118]OCF27129.1 26S proteasome regulatory subunit N10 [Kwoniella bestiolae CBS 10118]